MENHHNHHQNNPQYNIPQQYPHFLSDLFGFNIVSTPDQHHRLQFTNHDHEISFLPGGIHTVTGNNSNTVVSSHGLKDGKKTERWPRQETLMLLEVRSRLDHKFKEANQKGPLWDQVSRIMSEEHGYNTRSGKKCREKFENLYKYYKKTKEGKVGRRQDGKNYRFFRQLEAIYGESKDLVSSYNNTKFIMTNDLQSFHTPETHNNVPYPQSIMSTYNNFNSFSELDPTSSSEEDESIERDMKDWKEMINEFIGGHMKRLIEKQDIWLEKLMKTMEEKEYHG